MNAQSFIDKYGPLLAKAAAIDKHSAQKRSWPWYGLVQHLLFVSWRCPACIAEREWCNDKESFARKAYVIVLTKLKRFVDKELDENTGASV